MSRTKIWSILLLLTVALLFSACSKKESKNSNASRGTVVTEEENAAEDVIANETDDGENSQGSGGDDTENVMPMSDINLEAIRDIPSAELVTEMQVGWNLGNTLDSVNDSLTGDPEQYELDWGNPKTTKEMIDLLKESGFQVLRIPVSWKNHIMNNEDYLILEDWMDRVQEVVDYGIDNDMFVIINLHHEDWIIPSYDKLGQVEKELTSLWRQIAERFAGYDEHLIFEGMNEPRLTGTSYEWNGGTEEARAVINELNAAFVETIRASGGNNPLRHLMIPAYAASSDSNVLKELELPEDDKIIVSVHAYTPYDFTLNTKGTDKWSKKNVSDTGAIDSLFQTLNELFLSKGIPVIIGEFGAVDKNNLKARKKWTAYYMEKAREYCVPCIWWDNGAFEGDGENFGLMDRSKAEWAVPDLVEILTRE